MLPVLYFWLGVGFGLCLVTANLVLEAKKLRPRPWPRWCDLGLDLMHLWPR